MKSDEVFEHLAQTAWGLAIESVHRGLYMAAKPDAKGKINPTAAFGIMNAHDPRFGVWRQHSAEWFGSEWVAGIVAIAEKCFPLDLIPKFAEEAKAFSKSLFAKAGSKRK